MSSYGGVPLRPLALADPCELPHAGGVKNLVGNAFREVVISLAHRKPTWVASKTNLLAAPVDREAQKSPTALCRRASFRAWRWGDHGAMPWIRPSMVFWSFGFS